MSFWNQLMACFQTQSPTSSARPSFDKILKRLLAAENSSSISIDEVKADLRVVGRNVAPEILKWLELPGTDRFNVAAGLLAEWQDRRAVPLLISAVTRTEKVHYVDSRGGHRSVDPAHSFRYASDALVVLQCREAIAPLRQALSRQPVAAAKALGKLKDKESLPQITSLLNYNGDRCAAAAVAICELAPGEAFDLITKRQQSPGWCLNDEVADLLALIDPPRTIEFLERALAQPDHGFGKGAAAALARLSPDKAFDIVARAIRLPHSQISIALNLLGGVQGLDQKRYRQELRWLAENGQPSHYVDYVIDELLAGPLTRDDVDVLFRVAANTKRPGKGLIQALVKTRDPRAAKCFGDWLFSDDGRFQYALLLKGFEELNLPACIGPLLRVASHRWGMAETAVGILMKSVPIHIRDLPQSDLELLAKLKAVRLVAQSSDSDWHDEHALDCSQLHSVAKGELKRRGVPMP